MSPIQLRFGFYVANLSSEVGVSASSIRSVRPLRSTDCNAKRAIEFQDNGLRDSELPYQLFTRAVFPSHMLLARLGRILNEGQRASHTAKSCDAQNVKSSEVSFQMMHSHGIY
jgi:hypothetical protein